MVEAVGQVWRRLQTTLEAGHSVSPREARQLVQHVLELNDTELVLAENSPFPAAQLEALDTLMQRRLAGEPLAQILGFAWFYGRKWTVTPDVLIPRPDTEILVEAVLARLQARDRIAEVGVGTGCIGGTLLAERADVTLFGVDISDAAAAVARENLGTLDVDGRWDIIVNDGLESITESFNLIVSNPPYITDMEWENLEAEVKNFEPRLALTGSDPNADGLLFYRRLADWGRKRLATNGWLCVETGWQQGEAVRKLLQQESDLWGEISVLKDLGGRERVVCARRC